MILQLNKYISLNTVFGDYNLYNIQILISLAGLDYYYEYNKYSIKYFKPNKKKICWTVIQILPSPHNGTYEYIESEQSLSLLI